MFATLALGLLLAVQVLGDGPSAETRWTDRPDCGTSKYSDAGVSQPLPPLKKEFAPRIVNGWEARQGEFPWQAILRSRDTLTCGAVIISDTWLLTAAHCTDNDVASQLTVVVGAWKRTEITPDMVYQVASYIQHPDYDATGEIENDVALLQLTAPMTLTEDIQPACKPSGTYELTSGTTSGWGRLGTTDPLSNVLMYANNPLMDQQPCIDCFVPGYVLPGMLCWGYCGPNTQSTCNGDSGGPLVVQAADGMFDIVGLVSWGLGGCLSDYPPVFTNVSYFNDWIDANLPAKATPIRLY